MRIIAIIAARNACKTLGRCLQHLASQNIETCVIDNDSDDETAEIARSFEGRGVCRIIRQPFDGFFDLAAILRLKEKLAEQLPGDWFIHQDADEIREAPEGFGSLADGIHRADREGFNAINFDEFVFAPTSFADNHEESGDFVETMRWYYFFEPRTFRRVNAWKNTGKPVDLVSSAGHHVIFEEQKLYPRPFILRHYIALSTTHLTEKYGHRRFAEAGLKRGWHFDRQNFDTASYRLPDPAALKILSNPPQWDKSDPWKIHPFFSTGR